MPRCYLKSLPLLALTLLVMVMFSAPLFAQDAGCNYDKAAPSLDNARINFKSLNYKCAELELIDRLNMEGVTLQEKADTYVLLAAVYYAMMGDDAERRDKVVEQFTAAFRQYRDWKGTLEVTSSEFAELMEEAKKRVDSGEAIEEPMIQPVVSNNCPSKTPALIGTGVFVAAAAYYFISSGDASSKWDDYEADPTYPQSLYDDYESAVGTRNLVGGVTLAAGVVTGYLWMKYMSGKKDCENAYNAGLQVAPTSKGISLTYRF